MLNFAADHPDMAFRAVLGNLGAIAEAAGETISHGINHNTAPARNAHPLAALLISAFTVCKPKSKDRSFINFAAGHPDMAFRADLGNLGAVAEAAGEASPAASTTTRPLPGTRTCSLRSSYTPSRCASPSRRTAASSSHLRPWPILRPSSESSAVGASSCLARLAGIVGVGSG